MENRVVLISDNYYNVYKALTFIDKSINPADAKVIMTNNLINVTPTVHKNGQRVTIKKGEGEYDADILNWGQVKSLIRHNHIRVVMGSVDLAAKKPTTTASTPVKKVTKKSGSTVAE